MATILLEAMGYIKVLQYQVRVPIRTIYMIYIDLDRYIHF